MRCRIIQLEIDGCRGARSTLAGASRRLQQEGPADRSRGPPLARVERSFDIPLLYWVWQGVLFAYGGSKSDMQRFVIRREQEIVIDAESGEEAVAFMYWLPDREWEQHARVNYGVRPDRVARQATLSTDGYSGFKSEREH
jgi:hypothetical protein